MRREKNECGLTSPIVSCNRMLLILLLALFGGLLVFIGGFLIAPIIMGLYLLILLNIFWTAPQRSIFCSKN